MNEQPRRPSRPASPTAAPRRTPSGSSPSRRCGPSTSGTRTPTSSCRRCCGRRGRRATSTARDAALATELVYGTLRRQGTYDAIIAACVDRPLREVDPPVLDVLGARRAPAARDPDPDARRGVRERRAGAGGARRRAGEVRQRRAAQDRAGRPGRLAGAGRAALRRGRRGPSRRRALASALGRLRAVGLARRRARRDRGPAGGRQRAARGDAGRPARPVHRRGAARRAGRGVRRCRGAGRRTPCGWPRAASRAPSTPYGRAGPGCRTRAASSSRSPWPTRPLDGPDERWLDGCAGPGGKAALLAALAARARRRRCSPPRSSRTGPGWSSGRWPATPARTRSSPPTAPGRRGGPAPSTGCWWTCPCTGLGALRRRPEARWRRRPEDLEGFAPLQRGAAARGAGGRTGRRSRRLRDLLAAPRRDPGRRRRRAQGPRRRPPRPNGSTPGR